MSQRITTTDKWVTVDGLKLHYRDWGNESAQPMLLLHGFSSNERAWNPFARSICDEYHVLALDQLGHGDSDWLEKLEDYTYDRHAQAITGFVDQLGLDRLVVIGWSMGGRAGWTYTLKHPEKVERLVIVDVSPQVPVRPVASEYDRQHLEMMTKHDFDSFLHALSVFRFVWPLIDAGYEAILRGLRRDMIELPDGRVRYKWDGRLAAEFATRRQMPEETWETLRGIKCPTLLVRGALSETLSPELAKRMCDTIPNCEFAEVPDSGHAVPTENPSGFEAAVREFLQG